MTFTSNIKSNIAAKMRELGLSAGEVSRRGGHYRTWMSDHLRRGHMSTVWIEEVAEILGVEAGELTKGAEG
jgi:lambda repressor-like predicted transcriptional regulator